VDTFEVLGDWQEPIDWQQPRPALFVRGQVAYVTDPSAKQVHALDVESGKKLRTTTLPEAPNEISGPGH
jgi:hypothetical protein